MTVEKFLRPALVKSVCVGGPHTHGVELGIVRNTEKLWWRCCQGTVQWVNMHGPSLCKAAITAADTWTDFDSWNDGTVTGVPFKMPYRMSEGFEKIMGLVGIASEVTARFRVRLVVETLIDAVTTTNGDQSGARYTDDPLMMSAWVNASAYGGGHISWAQCVAYVVPTDYSDPDPGVFQGPDRAMAIRPQVKIDEESFDNLDVAGVGFNVYIHDMTLCDIAPAEVGAVY